MDFLAMDKISFNGQKNFVQDNLGFVLDKNYFVRAEGRGTSGVFTEFSSHSCQITDFLTPGSLIL